MRKPENLIENVCLNRRSFCREFNLRRFPWIFQLINWTKILVTDIQTKIILLNFECLDTLQPFHKKLLLISVRKEFLYEWNFQSISIKGFKNLVTQSILTKSEDKKKKHIKPFIKQPIYADNWQFAGIFTEKSVINDRMERIIHHRRAHKLERDLISCIDPSNCQFPFQNPKREK